MSDCILVKADVWRNKWNNIFDKYQCPCGEFFNARRWDVKHQVTRSCGCLKRKISQVTGHKMGLTRRTHGESSNVPEYAVWAGVIQRCTNPNHISWKNYGGRGISVCRRWLKYQNFITDMGRRPTDRHSIDRINNNGNYEPGNCRWATRVEQNNNNRRWQS